MHHLQPTIVNDQVFPNVATGFGDTLPAMREQTVKVSSLFINLSLVRVSILRLHQILAKKTTFFTVSRRKYMNVH